MLTFWVIYWLIPTSRIITGYERFNLRLRGVIHLFMVILLQKKSKDHGRRMKCTQKRFDTLEIQWDIITRWPITSMTQKHSLLLNWKYIMTVIYSKTLICLKPWVSSQMYRKCKTFGHIYIFKKIGLNAFKIQGFSKFNTATVFYFFFLDGTPSFNPISHEPFCYTPQAVGESFDQFPCSNYNFVITIKHSLCLLGALIS